MDQRTDRNFQKTASDGKQYGSDNEPEIRASQKIRRPCKNGVSDKRHCRRKLQRDPVAVFIDHFAQHNVHDELRCKVYGSQRAELRVGQAILFHQRNKENRRQIDERPLEDVKQVAGTFRKAIILLHICILSAYAVKISFSVAFYEKMRPVSIRIDSGFSRLRMLEPARDAIKASVLSKKRPGLPETEGNAGRKTLLPQ